MNSSELDAILVHVDEVWGSAPRDAGTSMVVREDGIEGTIGGGALEWRAMAHARELIAGMHGPWSLDLPLGPTLAQCCGGRVRLGFKPFPGTQTFKAFQDRVHLYGLGHVGQAVLQALRPLPFDIHVYDERASILEMFDAYGAVFHNHYQSAGLPGDLHLVMTHSHQIDLTIVSDLMSENAFGYLGLIGSATKRARFERALRAQGISNQQLMRLVCPIGIAGIRDKAPPAIAASVTAQLLLVCEALRASDRNKQLVTPPE